MLRALIVFSSLNDNCHQSFINYSSTAKAVVRGRKSVEMGRILFTLIFEGGALWRGETLSSLCISCGLGKSHRYFEEKKLLREYIGSFSNEKDLGCEPYFYYMLLC